MTQQAMQTTHPEAVRPRSFEVFHRDTAHAIPGGRRWLMRSQNFIVEGIECDERGTAFSVASSHEILLLLPVAGATIRSEDARIASVDAPGHAVCILPAGRYQIALQTAERCYVLATHRPDLDDNVILNAAAYVQPDPRIAPVGTPYRRIRRTGEIIVVPVSEMQPPADNPRLKILQSDTMSINWVEYEGPRSRARLSPHRHANLEQGSLAIMGTFVHHLRVEWGSNADLWQDDEHLKAPSPSMLVIPVNLTHTTEGVDAGRHILIDVFAPPRADFIAKGWVLNSADYESPQPTA